MSTDLIVHKPGALRPAAPRPPDENEMFELRLYWRSIAKRKWAILGVALVAAVIAALYALSITPVYRAVVTILIEQNRSRVVSVEEVTSGISSTREHFETQADILASRALATRVIEKLKLTENPEFDPRQAKPSRWQRAVNAVFGSDEQKPPSERQV